MSNFDTRPPSERLDSFAVKHLIAILRHLRGGSIGFDPARDERTNSKERLVSFIRREYGAAMIDEAHNAVRASYGEGGNNRSSRRQRRGSNVNMGEAFESDDASEAPDMSKGAAAPAGNVPASSAAAQMAALLQSMAAEQINETRVQAIVDGRLSGVVSDLEARITEAVNAAKRGATLVEIKVPDLPPINVGVQHQKFPLLLKVANARLRDGTRLNAWLAGPAGTGKTTAAKNVAKALELAFYFNGAIDSPYKLTGFTDANGRTIRTAFREAWEHGGVYLFDEVDASSPGAILEFNAALANGVCSFPDAVVERHPDCIVIAGANTTGLGASLEYVGRMKQDAAFLDRFVVIEWPLDPGLESAICSNDGWTARVRSVRERVKARGIKGALITPRATVYGEALLAAGIDQKTVEALTLRKGMADDVWGQVS
jgi:cobaltochelatase CobS